MQQAAAAGGVTLTGLAGLLSVEMGGSGPAAAQPTDTFLHGRHARALGMGVRQAFDGQPQQLIDAVCPLSPPDPRSCDTASVCLLARRRLMC